MLRDIVTAQKSLFIPGAHTELRAQKNRTRRVVSVKGNLMGNSRVEESGVSARVRKNGVYGFSSMPELSEEAAKATLPLKGTVLISVNSQERDEAPAVAKILYDNGFKILATGATCDAINAAGIPAEKVKKLYEGRPNILDLITNGEIDLIINSPIGKASVHDDSYIRKAAIKSKIPYITTIVAGKAAAEGIDHMRKRHMGNIHSLQEWHELIKDVE